MIKTFLTGNLGDDAVHKVLPDEKNVINFSVAVNKKYKDKQGNTHEKTTWVGVSYWPRSIGILPYLKKGAKVYVEGEPEANAYSKNNNEVVAELKLTAHEIELL